MRAAITLPPQQRSSAVARASFAALRTASGFAGDSDREAVCQALFPNDEIALRVLRSPRQRAAVDPGDFSAWGTAPIGAIALDFLKGLGPESAIARLITRGVSFPIASAFRDVTLPRRADGPAQFGWIGEGAAIPLTEDATDGATLPAPKKVGGAMVFTREFFKLAGASEAVDAVLRESIGRSLDRAYLNEDAAGSENLVGLLNAATDVSSGLSPEPRAALASMARAVASGSTGAVSFIASAGRAAEIGILVPELRNDVFGTLALGDNTLVAIDHASLAHGAGEVDISAAREAVLHRSDDPSADLGGGDPTPISSLFQQDMVAARVTLDLTWVSRRAGAVAFATGIPW